MTYEPKPIDTSGVTLLKALDALTEFLAENTHEIWAKQRISDGWTYGDKRDDRRKEHPGLVPYEQLSESEKAYDRLTAMEVLKTIQVLGYQILLPAAGSDAAPATEATTLTKQLKAPTYIDFPTLHQMWQSHSQDRWRHLPEIYRLLGERILKIGDLALAREILSEGLAYCPKDVRLRQLLALALARSGFPHRANHLLQQLRQEGHTDEETLGILARTHKDLWKAASTQHEREKQLRLAYEAYDEAYRRTGGFYSGINAATLALLRGEKQTAQTRAAEVRELCHGALGSSASEGEDVYWLYATLGEAALVLGQYDEAETYYAQAAKIGRGDLKNLSSTQEQLRLLLERLDAVPQGIEFLFPMSRETVDNLVIKLNHDIKNELNGVHSAATLLQSGPLPHAEVSGYATEIIEAGEQMNQNLNRVSQALRHGRFDTLALSQNLSPHDLSALVETTIEGVRPRAQVAGVAINWEKPEPPSVLMCHPASLAEALRNLMINALDAMPNGGALTIEMERRKTDVRLRIHDAGHGIAPELLKADKIFEEFFTTKTGGAGMGLAQVRETVEVHRGQIRVESVVAKGTEFTLILPFTEKYANEQMSKRPEMSHRILLVEDHESTRKNVQRLLSMNGYQVVSVMDKNHAVAEIRAQSFDAALIDLRLPVEDGATESETNGLAVVCAVRAHSPHAWISVVTGYGDAQTARRAMVDAGANDFLEKPIDYNDLRLRLENALANTPGRGAIVAEFEEWPAPAPPAFRGIVGESPAIKEVIRAVETCAASTMKIGLVWGESGVGKELVCRAIHQCSLRSDAPYHIYNCAAITETLAPAELFGVAKRVANDVDARDGYFQRADGGTLVLDEAQNLTETVQAQLLRAVQYNEVQRVGGKIEKVDVRTLLVTNRNLLQLVAEGKFRQDLLNRTLGFHIQIPPLRARKADSQQLLHLRLSGN